GTRVVDVVAAERSRVDVLDSQHGLLDTGTLRPALQGDFPERVGMIGFPFARGLARRLTRRGGAWRLAARGGSRGWLARRRAYDITSCRGRRPGNRRAGGNRRRLVQRRVQQQGE